MKKKQKTGRHTVSVLDSVAKSTFSLAIDAP